MLGVEISAALKNIIAIAAGIVQGSGYGYNTKTALIARSMREIAIFMKIYGADGQALYGLAGIGWPILFQLIFNIFFIFIIYLYYAIIQIYIYFR